MNEIKIESRRIGGNNPVFFIAEAGVNHNGSTELGLRLIDAAVEAKADAVKFQTFKTDNIITPEAPKSTYHIQTTGGDKVQTWYELLKTQEISENMHIKLMKYCKQKNIIFMSTPYDKDSVDLLDELGVSSFKTASTDTNNIPLLRYIARKAKPTIISTAMSTMEEVENAVKSIKEEGLNEIGVLQCTGNYPANLSDSNLNIIKTFENKLECVIGYSDHTEEIINPIAATAMGAKIYEKHFTIDKTLPGPDHRMALDPMELKETIKLVRDTETALGNNTKSVLECEKENRGKLRKSIVIDCDMTEGTVIEKDMLTIKRPGYGIAPEMIDQIVGKKVNKNLKKYDNLKEEDISI